MRRRLLWQAVIISGLLIITGADTIFADIHDIRVNTDNTTTDQNFPRVAFGGNGCFVVIWSDKRNGQNDIYCQMFDTSGNRPGGNIMVNDDGSGAVQSESAIESDGFGHYPAVWRDYRNDTYPFYPDIYASCLDSLEVGTNFNITTQIQDLTCEAPDAGVFSNGSFVVVWADYRNSQWDIYGQRVLAGGSLVGGNFKINSDGGTNQQHAPRVAAFSDGGFVVTWYDNRGGDDDIYAQIFDSSATMVGSNFRVNDDVSKTRQAFPAIAADGNNRFFIAWVDWRNGSYPINPDIYLRRFKADGTAFTASRRLNTGDPGFTQKEVSLCSDRMGNIGAVWADSASGQFDVMAQIIDYNGQISGGNFAVHESSSGRQLQPDVDSDGYKFFFVWADNRSGNFDIYATIEQYNNPTLIPDPACLTFTMEEGGNLPSGQSVTVSNAGFGELEWTARPEVDWLSVSPDSGSTPASFTITPTADTFSYGTYYGYVHLIDLEHHDSSEVVSVTLIVTAPLLEADPDTLEFSVLAELGNPERQYIRVNNTGTGNLEWTVEENIAWFSTDINYGEQGDSVGIDVDIAGLPPGDYYGSLALRSDQAANSPETAWVHLDLAGNMACIEPDPDSIERHGIAGDTLTAQIIIRNPGTGSLDWNATCEAGWLELDKTSGSDNDTINLTIMTETMSTGYHEGALIIYDSASFNQAVSIPVLLYLSSGDSVQFYNASAEPGGIGVMPLYITLINASSGGYIPFTYDTTTAVLDSIVIRESNFPDFVTGYRNVEAGRGEIGFRVIDSLIGDSLILTGEYYLADLFFTAGEVDVFNTIDTLSSDSSGMYFLAVDLTKQVGVVIPGQLIIGEPTAVDDEPETLLPDQYRLEQNYPNPFNSQTIIELTLPQASSVSIVIYNILGQEVCRLYNGFMSSGTHRLVWNSILDNGYPAPSGLYFYRLDTSNRNLIKKMLLLK